MAKTIDTYTLTDIDVRFRVEHIITLHYFKYNKSYCFYGEKHDFWEIVYVDRGEVGVLAENSGSDLHQGEAVFHKPNEYHNIWAKDSYANVVVFSFVCNSPAMSFFEKKIVRFDDEQKSLLGRILKEGEGCFKNPLSAINQEPLAIVDAPPFGCLQSIGNLNELLLISLTRVQATLRYEGRISMQAKLQGDNQVVESIKRYLDDNLYRPLSLTDVIEQICFSKTYLTRLFRKHTGQSVMGYYLDRKIAEAQRLISERTLSFTQIAAKLRFHSVHHFSNTFKKHTGMAPSEYAKSVLAKNVL